jgi:transposase
MTQAMTRGNESSAATGFLLVAFELRQRWWKVGFPMGMGHRVRTRRIAAGELEPLAQAIADAKRMFGLAADAPVISCYEAGRDGFWLHRYLTGRGDTNYVVDSASIEVDRRARRTKTDAVDLRGLLALLARYVAGDRRCWRVVRVPSVADEDARQLHRTWETLQSDRTRMINRLTAVLASHGVRLTITADFLEHVAAARVWDGSAIPPGARERLAHDWAQLQRIELYQSGATQRDRGITRAGNAHVRRMMVQLAWGWLRGQSDSALAQWYRRRFATGGSRQRRIGIVAVARKLLIALWRYVDQAIVPEGARLKVALAYVESGRHQARASWSEPP